MRRAVNCSCQPTVILIVSLLLVVMSPGISASRADDQLQAIIEQVKQNEALYSELDVTMTAEYSIGDRKVPPPGKAVDFVESINERERIHFVNQGQMFRMDRTGMIKTANNEDLSKDRICAFDGTTTRVLEQKKFGNIVEGEQIDSDAFRPHMLLLHFMRYMTPLSTNLSGHEAMLADPNSGWNPEYKREILYRGEEEVDGLKCHKVWITMTPSSGEPHNRWVLWLAEERNYIPAKIEAYTFMFSTDIPVGGGSVDEWMEVKPGMWCPNTATYTSYNKRHLQSTGERKLQWERKYVVEKVSLEPQYELAYFQDVPMPDGTQVNEIKDRQVTRSYVKGAPQTPDEPKRAGQPRKLNKPKETASSKWWLLWVNLAIVGVIAAIFFYRTRRNNAP